MLPEPASRVDGEAVWWLVVEEEKEGRRGRKVEKKKKKIEGTKLKLILGNLRIDYSKSKCLLAQSFISSLESSLLRAPARIVRKGQKGEKSQKGEKPERRREKVRKRFVSSTPTVDGANVERKENSFPFFLLLSFPHPMYVLFELGTARELSR